MKKGEVKLSRQLVVQELQSGPDRRTLGYRGYTPSNDKFAGWPNLGHCVEAFKHPITGLGGQDQKCTRRRRADTKAQSDSVGPN